jgi:hypothetical protein
MRPDSMPSNDTGAGGSLYRRRARLRGMAAGGWMPMGGSDDGVQSSAMFKSSIALGPQHRGGVDVFPEHERANNGHASLRLDHEV